MHRTKASVAVGYLPQLLTLPRFAEVEVIVTLSMLVRNYRIEIQADPRFAGETFQERRSRILAFTDILSLKPRRIPVNLVRR
jgi:hypothetical protein